MKSVKKLRAKNANSLNVGLLYYFSSKKRYNGVFSNFFFFYQEEAYSQTVTVYLCFFFYGEKNSPHVLYPVTEAVGSDNPPP